MIRGGREFGSPGRGEMIAERYFQWALTAPAGRRAEAASAMARSWLYADLPEEERRALQRALTALLDDGSPLVRRSLAEALAGAAGAPHHIILALAHDQSDISALILSRSPVLSEAELIDCAAIGDVFAQCAIAIRPALTAPVAAALAEVGQREAAVSLCVNPGADIPEFSLRRLLQRFGDDGEMREAVLARADLPAALRHDLVGAAAQALSDFVQRCDWLSPERCARVTQEAREKAALTIAATSGEEGPAALIRHLRACGALTAGFALRCLLSGSLGLFAAILAELSGLDTARVSGLMGQKRGAGFSALYAKAGMPPALLPAFSAALGALRDAGAAEEGSDLSLPLIERVVGACEAANTGALDKLLALLRRFEAEAARDEARRIAQEMRRPQAPPVSVLIIDEEAMEAAMLSDADEELLQAA